MQALLTVLTLLAGNRADRFKRHAGAQIGLGAALAICMLLSAIFAIVLGVHLLSLKVGMAWALTAGLGVFLFASLILAVIRRLEARKHKDRQADAAAREKLLLTQALLTSFGGPAAKSAIVVAIAAMALGLLGLRGNGDGKDDHKT